MFGMLLKSRMLLNKWTTDNIDQNTPNINKTKQIGRYPVLVVFNRWDFTINARQKNLYWHFSITSNQQCSVDDAWCCVERMIRGAVWMMGMCGKPKFVRIRFFLKPNRHQTVQKFDIRSDSFSTETACKFAIYVKGDKKLLYLHSNVHIKNSLITTETEISI